MSLDVAVNRQKINQEYFIFKSLLYFTNIFNLECFVKIMFTRVTYMNKKIMCLSLAWWCSG